MKIINKTKNTVLASEVIIADSLLKRMKGLLGRKEFKEGQAIILAPCNGIHTFFMRFPIDVLFVDRENMIIALRQAIKPFRLSAFYRQAKFVIELAAGSLIASGSTKGDILELI